MLRRSLGSPPAQRHPRQACLEPRFACQPLHSLAGWRWSCVRAGEYCSCTSGRRPRSSCVPPPPPLPNFPLVVSSQGKTMGKSRSRRLGGRPRCLAGVWCVCAFFCIPSRMSGIPSTCVSAPLGQTECRNLCVKCGVWSCTGANRDNIC
jgi:hypothetical protein